MWKYLAPVAIISLLLIPVATRSQVVCKTGERACGTQCYSPEAGLHCDSGIVCKTGERACKSQCYDPKGFHCDRGIVCRHGQEACGGKCIDPNDRQACAECHKDRR